MTQPSNRKINNTNKTIKNVQNSSTAPS